MSQPDTGYASPCSPRMHIWILVMGMRIYGITGSRCMRVVAARIPAAIQ